MKIIAAKSNNRKECMICHYWFFYHAVEFQDYVLNGFHNFSMFCLNISNIITVTVQMLVIVILFIILTKSEAINFLENYVLQDRNIYKNIALIV